MKHPEHRAPPYTEAQATAWLAWLARGMQQHGQTLFLIEQLQPSWLSTRRQRWVYILTSRLIWGIVSGLIYGLPGGLGFSLIIGLSFGLILGLIGSTMDMADFGRKRSRWAQNKPATPLQIIGGSLLFGLLGGLLGGLLSGLLYEQIGRLLGGLYNEWYYEWIGVLFFGLSSGLVSGLLFGVFWMSRSYGRDSRNEIHTVETIRYSWADVPRRLAYGLIFGLILGLIFGLLVSASYQPDSGFVEARLVRIVFFISGIITGVSVGVIVALISCIQHGIRAMKTIPNQGIRLSVRNAGLMGGLGGLGLGLVSGVYSGWTYGLAYGVLYGLAYGVLGGLCIGLWYGGLDVIQHYLVRLLLWRAGAMPRDYARFLDYAAEELTFLQRVGGGYIFVHRYLLEYFAAMEVPDRPVAADGDTVSQPAVTTGESV